MMHRGPKTVATPLSVLVMLVVTCGQSVDIYDNTQTGPYLRMRGMDVDSGSQKQSPGSRNEGADTHQRCHMQRQTA